MITPQDDFMGHQLPTTFDHVVSSDPDWMERYWYTLHPVPGGDKIIDIGLGYYPNKNVMDCFVGIMLDGKQHNFRASRHLRPNALETTVGPLSIKVIEGLRRHRIVLEPNDSGIACDLEFIASMNPHEEDEHFRRRKGRVTEHMARMEQLGRFKGWFEVDGKRHEINPDVWWGQRDHSWGIRAEMRTDEKHPPVTFYPPFFYAWTTIQFEKRGLHIFFKERAPGDMIYITGEDVRPIGERAKESDLLTDVSHEVKWANDPLGQTVESAVFTASFANGTKREITIETLPGKYFLKGGLYGGLDGWFHGTDKGKLFTAHESWDLSDPEVRKKVRTLADHVIRVTDQGEVGYGIMEYGVGKGYEKYPEVQMHPAI
ncbi:MAG: hypothetical protein H6883_00260 [Rhodobiaceae bacterium]|nr:hypothetical protein [Rhodobiaceae bacterium]MCC0054547.1 hypothetical protein [Rhodobiaceae bacterium]